MRFQTKKELARMPMVEKYIASIVQDANKIPKKEIIDKAKKTLGVGIKRNPEVKFEKPTVKAWRISFQVSQKTEDGYYIVASIVMSCAVNLCFQITNNNYHDCMKKYDHVIFSDNETIDSFLNDFMITSPIKLDKLSTVAYILSQKDDLITYLFKEDGTLKDRVKNNTIDVSVPIPFTFEYFVDNNGRISRTKSKSTISFRDLDYVCDWTSD